MATGDAIDLSGTIYTHYYQKQIIAAAYVCISVVGLVGNFTILLAGLLSLQPRTKTSVFIFNMAVADLLSNAVLAVNVAAMLGVPSEGKPPVRPGLCTLSGYVVVISIGCSLNNIACVALYRALITTGGRRPLLMSLFTTKGLVAMVCTSWFVPMATALIPIFTEYGSYEYGARMNTCTYSPASKGGATFHKIIVVVFYPMQLLVTFCSYAAIFVKVRKHLRSIKQHAPPVTGPSEPPAPQGQSRMSARNEILTIRVVDGAQCSRLTGPLTTINSSAAPPQPLPAPPPNNTNLSRRSLTITMNMVLVLICFIACFMPYAVLSISVSSETEILIPFFGCLLVVSSVLNPLIYITRHPDFKKVCRCILTCKLAEIPKKSALLRRMLAVKGGSSGD